MSRALHFALAAILSLSTVQINADTADSVIS